MLIGTSRRIGRWNTCPPGLGRGGVELRASFVDAGAVRDNQRPLHGTGVRVHHIDLVNGNLHPVTSIPADNTSYGG
jgi:hypothetical protein